MTLEPCGLELQCDVQRGAKEKQRDLLGCLAYILTVKLQAQKKIY